jgi:hypothetical protein
LVVLSVGLSVSRGTRLTTKREIVLGRRVDARFEARVGARFEARVDARPSKSLRLEDWSRNEPSLNAKFKLVGRREKDLAWSREASRGCSRKLKSGRLLSLASFCARACLFMALVCLFACLLVFGVLGRAICKMDVVTFSFRAQLTRQ